MEQKQITVQELAEWLEKKADHPFRLVDVRELDEYDFCKIRHSELIPLSQFADLAPQQLSDKSTPMVIYCHHGMRSQRASDWLESKGYQQVYNLSGGIHEWAEQMEPEMPRY